MSCHCPRWLLSSAWGIIAYCWNGGLQGTDSSKNSSCIWPLCPSSFPFSSLSFPIPFSSQFLRFSLEGRPRVAAAQGRRKLDLSARLVALLEAVIPTRVLGSPNSRNGLEARQEIHARLYWALLHWLQEGAKQPQASSSFLYGMRVGCAPGSDHSGGLVVMPTH